MKHKNLIIWILLSLLAFPHFTYAKKKPKPLPTQQNTVMTEAGKRLQLLSAEDQRRFDALSKHQQNLIREGKIEKGFNAWMVKLALGEPYYGTEHHPVFVDYEEVWLYTKPDMTEEVKEERILDPQNNNWPTLHRKTRSKTCLIGDFFVLWDRGVVVDMHPTNEKKVYGSCTIQTEEAYLPIVDGKPVEPRR